MSHKIIAVRYELSMTEHGEEVEGAYCLTCDQPVTQILMDSGQRMQHVHRAEWEKKTSELEANYEPI